MHERNLRNVSCLGMNILWLSEALQFCKGKVREMEEKTDLRVLKTYKALCDTFTEMLAEKKFEDITVNELCERAMVRRATFYKHFADKYEFFAFFVRGTQEDFNGKIKEYDQEETPYSYYVYLLKKSVSFLQEHRKIVDNVLKSSAFPTLLEIVSEEIYRNVLLNMKENVKKGMLLAVSPNILASFYTGGMVQTLRIWVTTPNQITEEEMVKEIENILNLFAVGNDLAVQQDTEKLQSVNIANNKQN